MLNDIARDNRVKDRLEELKILSLSDEGVCVSGGVDNKEGLAPWTWKVFGGGKAKVAPETPKNEETSENKSAVEERSVSSLQTREAEVQARESEVERKEESLKKQEQELEETRNRIYKERTDMHKFFDERQEMLSKSERNMSADSFDNLYVFYRFYRDTFNRILMQENHERCGIPFFMTEWFVLNWKRCRSMFQGEYAYALKRDMKLPLVFTSRFGMKGEKSEGVRIDVRPGSQRVVIFYLESKMDTYMYENRLTREKALWQLHKMMPYDDDHADANEDTDLWEADSGDIEIIPHPDWLINGS